MGNAVRLAAVAALSFGLALPAAGGAAPPGPRNGSWGKAGVDYDQYRNDAVDCARLAANMDVAGTQAAQKLVAASRELDRIADTLSLDTVAMSPTNANAVQVTSIVSAGSYQHTMNKYRPDRQFDVVRDLQYQALAQCLTGRGYVRFQLTPDQARQLRRLKLGSLERRQYLHRLASDAAVLERQRL